MDYDFASIARDGRLAMLGARLHELETRSPGAIEPDKWQRTNQMFWEIIESPPSPELDARWVSFCYGDKMWKYLKFI